MAILHIRDVPDDLHKAVRKECIDTGESLREFVIESMRREMKRRGKVVGDDEAET